jgi:hypothetical protein
VLTGSIPVDVGAEDAIDLTFCVLAASTVPTDPTDPTDQTSAGQPIVPATDSDVVAAQDPTMIATGGGPSGRTALTLLAFVILALSGSSTMLLWSRGG